MLLKITHSYKAIDNEKTNEGSYDFSQTVESDSNQDLTGFLSNPNSVALSKFGIKWYDRKLYTYEVTPVAPIDIFEITAIPKAECSELLVIGRLRDTTSNTKLGFFDLSLNSLPFGKMQEFHLGAVAGLTGECVISALNIPSGYKFELYIFIGKR